MAVEYQYLGTGAAEGMPATFCACPVCLRSMQEGGKSLRMRACTLLGDDVLIEKVQFALICTCFIQLLGIYRWLTDGRLTHWEQICLCKACSREIEYNEDNVEAVSRFLTMD